jgi:histidine phosphotransferase ChpT
MRDDALNLIGSSARKLVALVAFARVAFGASQAAETFDTRELKTLTEGVFANVRPNLDWALELDQLNKPAARALLNLAQIAASVLPTGGVARLEARNDGETIELTVDAKGPRARLRPEVAKGLAGEKLEEGLSGHWVQAYYLYALLRAAGGRRSGCGSCWVCSGGRGRGAERCGRTVPRARLGADGGGRHAEYP